MTKMLLVAVLTSSFALAKGGTMIELHTQNISAFDASVSGVPLAVGGMGCATIRESLCIGGEGAGVFPTSASSTTQFGMGYGGALIEQRLSSLVALRLTLGAGAYRVNRVVSETESEISYEKLGSGWFFVVHPKVSLRVPAFSWLTVATNFGLFATNVPALTSLTVGANLFFH